MFGRILLTNILWDEYRFLIVNDIMLISVVNSCNLRDTSINYAVISIISITIIKKQYTAHRFFENFKFYVAQRISLKKYKRIDVSLNRVEGM